MRDRYVRVCGRLGHAGAVLREDSRRDRLMCPHGHRASSWAVVDRVTRQVLAACSVERVVLEELFAIAAEGTLAELVDRDTTRPLPLWLPDPLRAA